LCVGGYERISKAQGAVRGKRKGVRRPLLANYLRDWRNNEKEKKGEDEALRIAPWDFVRERRKIVGSKKRKTNGNDTSIQKLCGKKKKKRQRKKSGKHHIICLKWRKRGERANSRQPNSIEVQEKGKKEKREGTKPPPKEGGKDQKRGGVAAMHSPFGGRGRKA